MKGFQVIWSDTDGIVLSVPEPERALVVGRREGVALLVEAMRRELVAHEPPADSLYVVGTDDNTVRVRATGNVVAACGDRFTAALVAVLFDRFDESHSTGEPELRFPLWKGPYAS